MDIKAIGCFLQTKRKEKNYTQTELAKLLNVSHQAVSRWENGENLPDVMKLSELAKLYNISIDEIINCGKVKEEINTKPQTINRKLGNFKIFTIINIAVIFIAYILFFLLVSAGAEFWISFLVLYILIIAVSFTYLIPYINYPNRNREIFRILKINILFTCGAFLYPFISLLLSGYRYSIYHFSYIVVLAIILFIVELILEYVENQYYNSKYRIADFITKIGKKKIISISVAVLLGYLFVLSFDLPTVRDQLAMREESIGVVSLYIVIIGIVPIIYYLTKNLSLLNGYLVTFYIIIVAQFVFWWRLHGPLEGIGDLSLLQDVLSIFFYINVGLIILTPIIALLQYKANHEKFKSQLNTTLLFSLFVIVMILCLHFTDLELYIGTRYNQDGRYHVIFYLESVLPFGGITISAFIFYQLGLLVEKMYNNFNKNDILETQSK